MRLLVVLFWLLGFLALNKFLGIADQLDKTSNKTWLFQASLLAAYSLVIANIIFGIAQFYVSLFVCLSMVPLFVYYLFNKGRVYILSFVAGMTMNHLVIALNGGFMPVSEDSMVKIQGKLAPVTLNGGIVGFSGLYKYMTEDTVMPFLTDWIYFPYAGGIFSPGDVLIFLSFLLFLAIKVEEN